MAEFEEFPKMARLSREVIITEKIDGTNAQVYIEALEGYPLNDPDCIAQKDGLAMFVGSRSRWITPEDDNFGFAQWAYAHADELFMLGPGRHFGEWWGQGIQRKYGLDEKRLSLFNVSRWGDEHPACCHVVPTLFRGEFDTEVIAKVLYNLGQSGSVAAPGFMKPEGIVVFHTAQNAGFKKTLEKDDVPKSLQS
jgi:hypothetical protein